MLLRLTWLVLAAISGLAINSVATAINPSNTTEKYLLPVLYYGPGNQITGLKECLVLGRLLGRTVILTALKLHPSETNHRAEALGTRDWGLQHMLIPLQDVFDVPALHRHQPVVTLDEVRARGWGGAADGNIKIHTYSREYMKRFMRDFGIGLPPDAELLRFARPGLCDGRQLPRTLAKLARYHTLAVSSFQDVVPYSGYGTAGMLESLGAASLMAPQDACHAAYGPVTASLQKSEKMRRLATDFIAEELAPRFGAIHVRPYPDDCLDVWTQQPYDDAKGQDVCHTKSLFRTFGAFVADVLGNHSLTSVFVLCHPAISDVVDAALKAHPALKPARFTLARLDKLAQWRSTSLLAFVEQEIAERSTVFIGTLQSSISGSIAQQRASAGVEAGRNLYFPIQLGDNAKVLNHRAPIAARRAAGWNQP